jgi:hypothetical protein
VLKFRTLMTNTLYVHIHTYLCMCTLTRARTHTHTHTHTHTLRLCLCCLILTGRMNSVGEFIVCLTSTECLSQNKTVWTSWQWKRLLLTQEMH